MKPQMLTELRRTVAEAERSANFAARTAGNAFRKAARARDALERAGAETMAPELKSMLLASAAATKERAEAAINAAYEQHARIRELAALLGVGR